MVWLWLTAGSLLWSAALAGPTNEIAQGAAQPTSSAGLPADRNLIPNGDFEAGDITPTGWQTIDGFSTFWVKDANPAHGMVIKFNTDVSGTQAYEWWEKIRKGASPKDAPPSVSSPSDALGGADGVWFWSDPIPVEKGKAYWLTVDAKGTGQFYIWLVGYPEKPDTSFGADAAAFQGYLREKVEPGYTLKREFKAFIHKYVWKGQLMLGMSNEWKTYSRQERPFRPTANTPNVRFVRVMIWPSWPSGIYWVDNVRLVEVEDTGKK